SPRLGIEDRRLGAGYLAPGRGLADELILGFDEGRGVSTLGVGAGRLGVDELLLEE
ncbi:hypothetical protein PIB30_115887, partial [Stylosanthes scabra]|nr:hypothetical protein [Stylosanthes scabra]